MDNTTKQNELNQIKKWTSNNIFQKINEKNDNKEEFVFFDGPPFATGKPHFGHILAGTIKDTITRYQSMKQKKVLRRWGWDTHGLPIEHMINKTLNIESKQDVLKYGIRNYNNKCREVIMKCENDWRNLVSRMGRWIDFDNSYKTMDKTYMESVWWVFKELHKKNLVYKSFKVVPYSWKLGTSLSNFETGEESYKKCKATCVTVKFKIVNSDVFLVAWTTTPWSLYANLALCVNPKMTYVKVLCHESGEKYIMCKDLVKTICKSFDVLETMQGSDLVGIKYTPLYDTYEDWGNGAFHVVCDNFVTDQSGTGIVHIAPAFGEDDFRVCLTNKIILTNNNTDIPCPVDESANFTNKVPDFEGRHVRDCEKEIAKQLYQEKHLVNQIEYKTHRDKFCWRSKCQLINLAMPSWFIDVPKIKNKLLANNKKINWSPNHVGTKRFHNWLKDCRPWNVTRSRYWGTPLPIWMSEDESEYIVIGSIKELEEKAKLPPNSIKDIHRENIDHITIISNTGKILKRIPDVFDCWFESGCMPYGQIHYPFKEGTQKQFANREYLADFIAEGIDQTRGWFYSLHVISTALFNKPAFKNVIVNEIVLAEDGKKMSKSANNYSDPQIIIDKYGADALRLYLLPNCNRSFKFLENKVFGIQSTIIFKLHNTLRFLTQNIQRYEETYNTPFVYNESTTLTHGTNHVDKWIISCVQTLVTNIDQCLSSYTMDKLVDIITEFNNNFTVLYMNQDKNRFQSRYTTEETHTALTTLLYVLNKYCLTLAPIIPFSTDCVFSQLKQYTNAPHTSVHEMTYPTPEEKHQNIDIEKQFNFLKNILATTTILRTQTKYSAKTPIDNIILVISPDITDYITTQLTKYITRSLHVNNIQIINNNFSNHLNYSCTGNRKILGKKFKRKSSKIVNELNQLTNDQIKQFVDNKHNNGITILNETITLNDVIINITPNQLNNMVCKKINNNIIVYINTIASPKSLALGKAREVIRHIQHTRKINNLKPSTKINVIYKTTNAELNNIINHHTKYIENTIENKITEQSDEIPKHDYKEFNEKLNLFIYIKML